MKIRSQINWWIAIAGLTVPATFGMTFLAARNVEQAMRDMNVAEDFIDSTTQLRQVAVETVLFHEIRTQDQWQRKISSVSADLDLMRITTPREAMNLERIQKRIELMQTIYPRLIELDPIKEKRAVASILVVTQEMTDIGHEMIRGNRAEATVALRYVQVSVGLAVLAMGTLIVFVWHLVRRRILRPLRNFEYATKQLAAGNYTHRLNLMKDDEIGNLAAQFDAMIVRVEKFAVELQRNRDGLAEVVHARTVELSKAKDVAESLSQYARSLIEASLDPLVTISPQGKITDVNEASVEATGVPRQQLIGTDFSTYFTEPEDARAGYKKAFSEGLVRDYPLAIRHTTGRIMDVLFNAAVYADAKGNVLGVFAAARDVTVRKFLDQVLHEKNTELERATAAAEKANLGKSEFLSSMSHELRTPLNAILGFAQLMESDSPPPTPAQKGSLDQILSAGWYLLELINEILDLAQIESGKTLLSLEVVSLVEVMSECQSMVGPQADKRAIDMTFSPLQSTYYIWADRTRIKQALINLLSNAIKYNRTGGTVILDCTEVAPATIRISIEDTGVGLNQEQLGQLFQPFNRLGMESGGEEGTGIGLVVTKRLVELMGGTIGVTSTAGVGSLFWIEFKLATAPQLAIADAGHAALTRSPMLEDTRQRTLLYVEDNPANLQLIEELIARRADLRMLSAADCHTGIEFARDFQPDVILMDINLPGLNGFDAMKILRADPLTSHISIIALSANALPRDIENGLAGGFSDYLTKPIRVNELMDKLDLALKSSSMTGRPEEAGE